MSDESFDIRDVLAGRKYAEADVQIWTDDELFYKRAAIESQIAKEANPDEADRLTARAAQISQEIADAAVAVNIRAISPRAKEDIVSKALSQLPIKRDAYGREDDLRAIERTKIIRKLTFEQHVKKLTTADGRSQVLNDDNRSEVIQSLLDQAPDWCLDLLDAAIKEISKSFADRIAEWSDPAFS
jgi:hypothetical protein